MGVYAGLDVSLKRTEICAVDGEGKTLWRGVAATHSELIAGALARWGERIEVVGLETGSTTPWLARGLLAQGLPVVVMDARRTADALKARPEDGPGGCPSIGEMLRTGWYTEVFVKSEERHRIKALLLSRDQLVKMKRQIYGQIRGVLRPFGIRLPARAGTARFDAAARAAVCEDDVLYACIHSLLEALGAVEARDTRPWASASGRSCSARRPAGI